MAERGSCPEPGAYLLMLKGRDPAPGTDELFRHLEECPSCADAAEALTERDAVVGAVRSLGPTPADVPAAVEALTSRLVEMWPGAAAHEPKLPEEFGKYRVLSRLGHGGMGTVYLALDRALDRRVALKVPRIQLGTDPRLIERFLREARAAASLDHPNLCRVFEADTAAGVPYLAMPFLEGRSLAEVLRDDGPLPAWRAAELVRRVAVGMASAHAKGVVHRDLKPSNVLLTARGEPVVVDFGLALRDGHSDPRLTDVGVAMGTPSYMPPEHLDGQPAGPAGDVYGLGAIFYELLTGRPPFVGTTTEVLAALSTRDPEPPSRLRTGVPTALEVVCLRALRKSPKDRFVSMGDLAAALAEPAAPRAGRLTGRRVVAGVGMLGAMLLGLALLWPRPERGPLAPQVTNSLGQRLVLIRPGRFLMGTPKDEVSRRPDEGPRRAVEISRPFYLGAFEVTQAEFEAIMGYNPARFTSANGGGPTHLVEFVCWGEAVAFCGMLSARPEEQRAGRVYRLPTEAEWEYACRAGTTTAFAFGDALSSNQANFLGSEPYGGAPKGPARRRTVAVGSFPANAWGLHDMHGNVWEWCADWYDKDAYRDGPPIDPAGPAAGNRHVSRGGSWFDAAWWVRSGNRTGDPPQVRRNHIGFRVSCSAD